MPSRSPDLDACLSPPRRFWLLTAFSAFCAGKNPAAAPQEAQHGAGR